MRHSMNLTQGKFEAMLSMKCMFFALCVTVASSMPIGETRTCVNSKSLCFLKILKCPAECPSTAPKGLAAKVCYTDCNSPGCKAECKRAGSKPISNDPGAILQEKHYEHFSLVSDVNFQINARYVGHRQAGGSRNYSQVQALGVLFNQKAFTLEATHVAKWDDAVEHLKFTYNEDEIIVPQGHLSRSESSDSEIIVEIISEANSVLITVSDFAEISVTVVPITKEDDRIDNYQIPKDNCFSHLEVQFRLYGLSPYVEGLLGRTYQQELRNLPKPGMVMPIVGGEDKYRTASLLSPECSSCTYSPAEEPGQEDLFSIIDHDNQDYASRGKREWNIL